jgi:hypothetical protein
MSLQRRLLLLSSIAVLPSLSRAAPAVTGFRFGILKATPQGRFLMATETDRLPRKLKSSGFRFGLAFENPEGQKISWYEKVIFPLPPETVSGNSQRSEPLLLTTQVQTSSRRSVVDEFWFDAGDPLGLHRMELYVDAVRVFSVEFTVVAA